MTPPNATQLRVLQEAGLTTRTVSGPRKGMDEGKWGRICGTEGCGTRLNHFNALTTCEACQLRERGEAA